MTLLPFRPLLVLLAVLASATAGARQEPGAWPPAVQTVPARSPALSPDEAMKTFHLPPGYRLELVASEPMVQDPVWMDFDAEGRLWIVEMRGFMPDNEATGERNDVGRVVVLEDRDDDGRADRRTVFLDGLVLPRSVAVLEHGVLVVEPPNLWLAIDEDGDLRADDRQRLRDDFGLAGGNPEHNANGLLWGMDNWIYTSEHDGHLRLRDGRWEHRKTLARGQWGLSMDDVGRVYRNWNEMPLYVDLFPARYFMRNPSAVRTRGVYELTMPPDEMVVWPVRPTRGVNRGYREATLRDDGTLRTYVSAGTPTVYRGDRLPAELAGNVFVTEPAGNLVHRLVVEEDASGRIRARNAYERGEFIASTDERFRPVNLASAPDGTIYVADMYRGVIQHRQYQSEYLQNYVREHGLDQPTGYGRIYRVVHDTTARGPAPDLSRRTSGELVARLSHPNGWWRDTAQRLLVERGDRAVVPALESLAANPANALGRLHALWTLNGLDAITETVVTAALADPSPHVRAAAVRMSEPYLTRPGHRLTAAVQALMSDPAGPVRLQVALSLGELPGPERARLLTEMLIRHGNDPIVVDATVSGASEIELTVLNGLLAATAESVERGDAVAMLTGALTRRGADGLDTVLAAATDVERPAWQRLALLRGIREAARSRSQWARPDLRPRAVASLPRRPEALLALAEAGPGEISREAASTLDYLDWPGRARRTPAPAPLTPDEQARFATGRDIYERLCSACHGPDGGGVEAMAPPLVGSKWVLGSAGLAARIVMHGKEGERLMPPLPTLTDEQVAAVLTYVRRAWGHAASPVLPGLVSEARGASTGRSRPWTEEELEAVTQPDGPGR